MRYFLSIIILFATIPSVLAERIATYSIPLTRVEMLQTDSVSNDPIKILESDADKHLRSQYEDNRIQIIWKCDGIRFWFVLLNKTNYPITIDWDRITLINIHGEAERFIHNGIKYIDRNNGQIKTILPKFAKLNDFLVPANNCIFNSGGYFKVGGWQEAYLFPCVYKNNKDLKRDAPNLIGKTMNIDFPIIIGDKEYTYTFHFELNDLVQK